MTTSGVPNARSGHGSGEDDPDGDIGDIIMGLYARDNPLMAERLAEERRQGKEERARLAALLAEEQERAKQAAAEGGNPKPE